MSGDTCALRVCRFPASNSSSTCQLYQVQNQCQTIFGICNGGMFFFGIFPPLRDLVFRLGCQDWLCWVGNYVSCMLLQQFNLFSLFPSDTNQTHFFLCIVRNIASGKSHSQKGSCDIQYLLALYICSMVDAGATLAEKHAYDLSISISTRVKVKVVRFEPWGVRLVRSLKIPGQLEQKYWSYAIRYPVDGGHPTPADMENLPGVLWLQLRMFIWTGAGFLQSGVWKNQPRDISKKTSLCISVDSSPSLNINFLKQTSN